MKSPMILHTNFVLILWIGSCAHVSSLKPNVWPFNRQPNTRSFNPDQQGIYFLSPHGILHNEPPDGISVGTSHDSGSCPTCQQGRWIVHLEGIVFQKSRSWQLRLAKKVLKWVYSNIDNAHDNIDRRLNELLGTYPLRNVQIPEIEIYQRTAFNGEVERYSQAIKPTIDSGSANPQKEVSDKNGCFSVEKVIEGNFCPGDVLYFRLINAEGNSDSTNENPSPDSNSKTQKTASKHWPLPRVEGKIFLHSTKGISVFSDIDDTLKDSNAGNLRQLIGNAISKEYRRVDDVRKFLEGFKEMFQSGYEQQLSHYQRKLTKSYSFNYVSRTPWQLYPSIDNFIHSSGHNFPEGSITLSMTFKSVMRTFYHYISVKRLEKDILIENFSSKFPNRPLILIGDSTEKDPEVFGRLLRKLVPDCAQELTAENPPPRIMCIYIRKVSDGPSTSDSRFENAFKDIHTSRWKTFHTTSELNGVDPDNSKC